MGPGDAGAVLRELTGQMQQRRGKAGVQGAGVRKRQTELMWGAGCCGPQGGSGAGLAPSLAPLG